MFEKKVQEYLLKQMKNYNFSNKTLSESLSVNTSLLSELTKARKPYPSINTLTKIANLFDTSIDEILGRNQGKKKI
ncbi:MAG: helix-turn-helix domain-containing protein [Pseudomonadota bacterium]